MRRIPGCKALLVLQIALLLAVSSAWAAPAGDEVTIFAVGSSRIIGGDMPTGREEAVNAGLIMAVSRALADSIPIESVVGHFQVVNETVLNHTDQFVRDYKVLTESVTGDNYRLILQATVSAERLKDAIRSAGVQLGEIPYPHVLVCVAEKGPDDPVPRYWWRGGPLAGETISGSVLSHILSKGGFLMIGPDRRNLSMNLPPELSAAEAMDLGRRFAADVVVAGSARVDQGAGTASPEPGSYRGTLHAVAYRTTDGQPLAQIEKTVSVQSGQVTADAGAVFRKAAVQAGEELSVKMADTWFKQAALGTGIEIRVQGVGGNIANFVKFRGALSDISGLDNLQLKELASDTAVMTATYRGSAQGLGDAARQLNFDTFRISVAQAQGNRIEVQLAPR